MSIIIVIVIGFIHSLFVVTHSWVGWECEGGRWYFPEQYFFVVVVDDVDVDIAVVCFAVALFAVAVVSLATYYTVLLIGNYYATVPGVEHDFDFSS